MLPLTLRYRAYKLRSQLFGWVRQIQHPPRPVPWIKGLPEGISEVDLQDVCRNHFGKIPTRIYHRHLSGWKKAGAFRLFIKFAGGENRYLIFKDAIYSEEHITGVDATIRPGPAEYAVYKNLSDRKCSFLPGIYLAKEKHPGIHYQYILEDIEREYRKTSDAITRMKISAILPSVLEAMKTNLGMDHQENFFHYNHQYALALEEYARKQITFYAEIYPENSIQELLHHWDKIIEAHGRADIHTYVPAQLIHGDLNYSNLFFHQANIQKIKMVDWEWAGFGYPHSDLAAYLKGLPSEVEEQAFANFLQQNPYPSRDHQKVIYNWCVVDRSLSDIAYVAAQVIGGQHSGHTNFHRTIQRSATRLLDRYLDLL